MRAVFSALSVWVCGVLVVGVEVGLALITQRSKVQILPPQSKHIKQLQKKREPQKGSLANALLTTQEFSKT
jgi:hypothetical protein